MALLREFVIGMHLDAEVLARVNEFDEQREGVAELLIDTFADEQTFVFVNELGKVETEIHVPNDAAFDGYGFVTGHGTYLPRFADIGLCGKDALERGYLVSTPDGGT